MNWESKPLLELLSLIIDFRGRTPKKIGMSWGDGDIPALSANNVEMGRINLSKETYYGSEKLYQKWMTGGATRKGDVVLTTEAPLGNVAQIPDQRPYLLSQRTVLLRAKEEELENNYLYHYLMSEVFQNLMLQQSSGTTATGIQRAKLEKLPIKFPRSKTEQTKIAEVLSTVDQAIEQTEALIAKQQRIKTGLMQDLLTHGIDEHGNLRSEQTHEFRDSLLGRIPVEWEVCKLQDLCHLQRGHDLPVQTRKETGKIRVYGSNGVDGYHDKSITKGPGVITGRSGTIGKVHYEKDDYWPLNTTLYVIDFKHNYQRFVYYFLQTIDLKKYAAATGVPSLNRNFIHPLTIIKPSFKEQKRITAILDSASIGLDREQTNLTKLRSLKTALMQDLLTGKKRVTALLTRVNENDNRNGVE